MQENKAYLELLDKEYLEHNIGHGCCANCYMLNENEVIKLNKYKAYDYESISKNSKYLSDIFVFPKVLLFSGFDDTYAGYIMDYIDGVTIKELGSNIEIHKYIEAIKSVEEEITKMTNYRINLIDVSPSNVMYTKDDKMKVIDTDFYIHSDPSKKLYSINMFRFAKTAVYPLFDIYDYKFMENKIRDNGLKLIQSKILVSDYISMILDELEKKNYEVNNIGDYKKGLRLLRR